MAIIKSIEEEEQASCRHYDVFLSFRGPDTRRTFTNYLCRKLVERGYFVFRDDDEIPSGQNIQAELQKAIHESKVSIIVFSKDYASSKWCLDELVTIMKRHRQQGHPVIPVFYHVDPRDVRNQVGSFAESFIWREEAFCTEVERWRAALREAGALKGVAVGKDRYESDFIQEIVHEVAKSVRPKVLNNVPKLVGRERVIACISSWLLNHRSDNVGVAAICGIGGIGKTTVAREVYNLNCDRYPKHCFLEDVRATMKQHGLVYLQTKLLKALGYPSADSVLGVAAGTATIRRMVSYERVLLVLDDVDDLDQFDALVGEKEGFCSGSKIIITTRLRNIPKAHERDKIFEIMQLDDQESLDLLSWHAFGQTHPPDGYDKCSRDLVHYCSGLPLALKVLGSSLSGEPPKLWESKLQKLKANPNHKIKNVLEISYQSLPDNDSKKLFLDIACFCIGIDQRYAVKIFDACGFSTVADIRILENRCLLSIVDNKLTMHHLIEDMAKDLVRQESTEYPGRRSRIWDNEDAVTVLTQNTGTESMRGFRLNPLPSRNTSNTEEGSVSKLSRLSLPFWTPANNSPMLQCSTKAFAKMQHLKYLNLGNVELNGSFNHIPISLVWLRWQGSSWSDIPNHPFLEKVAVLEMPGSNLRSVWKGIRRLEHLKVLDLRQCRKLNRTPNFEGVPGLEILVLEDCTNLVEVDQSIGELVKLESLNLKNCRRLNLKLPVLKSLEELDISGCPNLGNLLEVLLMFESLKVLNADGITMKDFKEDKFRWRKSASWLRPRPRRYAHSSTGLYFDFLPRSLTRLSLVDCGLSDDIFPIDLSCLSSLMHLDLSGNLITSLPESTKQLPKLGSVTLHRCTKLQSVSSGPITSLFFYDIKLDSSTIIDVAGFAIGDIFKIQAIENIDRDVQKHLGLSSLEPFENTKLSLFNAFTRIKYEATIQVWQQYGTHHVFLPGDEFPQWFPLRVEGKNFICFDLDPVYGQELIGFSLCMKYCLNPQKIPNYHELTTSDLDEVVPDIDRGLVLYDPYSCPLIIINKTKGLGCAHHPIIRGIPGTGSYDHVLWLSYWRLQDLWFLQLEEGDKVEISCELLDFDVKWSGVRLVYMEQEQEQATQTEPLHAQRFANYYFQHRQATQTSNTNRAIPDVRDADSDSQVKFHQDLSGFIYKLKRPYPYANATTFTGANARPLPRMPWKGPRTLSLARPLLSREESYLLDLKQLLLAYTRDTSKPNTVSWSVDNKGQFTVTSRYSAITSQSSQHPHLLKHMWSLGTPKTKFFISLLLQDRLPTQNLLSARTVIPTDQDICPLCCSAPETTNHLLCLIIKWFNQPWCPPKNLHDLFEEWNFRNVALNKLPGLLVDAVNGGVQQTFMNEKRIEYEIRAPGL